MTFTLRIEVVTKLLNKYQYKVIIFYRTFVLYFVGGIMYFKYDDKAITYLKSVDKKLGTYIDKIGMINRKVNSNIFETLIFQIVGQQISNKAYITVKGRVVTLLKDITPKNIINCNKDDLQKCGISHRKVDYINNIANFWLNNENELQNIDKLSNKEIIDTLTQVKGVGIWTVEMLLIFVLQREDVLSYNDLVVRNNLMKLHNIEKPSKKIFEEYKKLYSPYGTIASFYLWEMNKV